MAAKFTRLNHKITIQLHLVTESCAIFTSRSRRPVQKLLDTFSYIANWEEFQTRNVVTWRLHTRHLYLNAEFDKSKAEKQQIAVLRNVSTFFLSP